MNIFAADMIPAPSNVPSLIEFGWQKWRDGETTDAELSDGLLKLFAWISATARDKPRAPLWEGY